MNNRFLSIASKARYTIIAAFAFGIATTLPLCTGCSFQNKSTSTDSIAMQREADSLFITVEELKRMTPEVKGKRKAAIILSRYISRKGDTYSLDISKEDALRLGVKEQIYDEIRRDVENTNSTIRQLMADGTDMALTDIRMEAERADSILRTKQIRRSKDTAEQIFKQLNEFLTDNRNNPLIDSLKFYSIRLNSMAGLVTVGLGDCSSQNITLFKTRVIDSHVICFKKEKPAVFD